MMIRDVDFNPVRARLPSPWCAEECRIFQTLWPCEPRGLAYTVCKSPSHKYAVCYRLKIILLPYHVFRLLSVARIVVLQHKYPRETHRCYMVIVLCIALAFACISFASPLGLQLLNPIPHDDTDTADSLLLPWSNDVIDTGTLQLNVSSQHVSNLSAPGSPHFLCQASAPGQAQTTLAACQEALRSVPQLPTSHREVTFGPREDLVYDVGLPREYMNTDGSCIILLGIKPRSYDARATPYDVGRAATSVIDRCLAGVKPAASGFIKNFGGDNNLLVGFTALPGSLRVTCEGSIGGPGIIESCNTLADEMPATDKIELFVRGHTPSTIHGVELPYSIKHGDRCAMEVTIRPSHRPTELSTWSTIYTAVVAINAKCIRHGQAGAWNNLGMAPDPYDQGRLQVRVYDLQTEDDSSSNLTTS